MAWALGIDIGGTNTKIAFIGPRGEVDDLCTLPTQIAGEPRRFVSSLIGLCEEKIHARAVSGIGIAVAGFLDDERTQLVYNPNLPSLVQYPLLGDFKERFPVPVLLEVDSNAACLAEYCYGAGEGSRRFFCLAAGTGLGGGMVVDGEILRYCYQCLGDVGHVIVEPEGPLCSCGGRGCAEALLTPSRLESRAKELLDGRQLLMRDIIAAAREGDAAAVRVLAEAGRWLGLAMASLAAIFFPDTFAIAGGLSEAGAVLLAPAEGVFRASAGDLAKTGVRVVKARLGWQATLIGAAAPFFARGR